MAEKINGGILARFCCVIFCLFRNVMNTLANSIPYGLSGMAYSQHAFGNASQPVSRLRYRGRTHSNGLSSAGTSILAFRRLLTGLNCTSIPDCWAMRTTGGKWHSILGVSIIISKLIWFWSAASANPHTSDACSSDSRQFDRAVINAIYLRVNCRAFQCSTATQLILEQNEIVHNVAG